MTERAAWRPMLAADLPAVSAVAAVVHPDYFERDEVFAERLSLHREGCCVLATGSEIRGYIFSHPWHAMGPPALDTLLGHLPDAPTSYYIHDIALLPAARGQGGAREAIAAAERRARSLRLAALSLVTVEKAAEFWKAAGFVAAAFPAGNAALASYGAGALYMTRTVGG